MQKILRKVKCLQPIGPIKLSGKMDIQQLKLYAINGSTLGVTTFTNIEMGLKLILLLVTIGYTIGKWIDLKNNKDGKN
jgi:hypothetical protein